MSNAPRLADGLCNLYYGTGYRPAPDTSETIAVLTGHKVTCGIPLIWCHGAGGSGLDSFTSYPQNLSGGAFVRKDPSGIVVLAGVFGNGVNFGCQDSIDAIDDAIAWSASRFGTRTDKVAIGGISMGGITSLNWAWRNPEKVVAWAGHIPGINLTWVHDNTSYGPFIELGFGDRWIELPGGAGDYMSTPNHVSFGITGDIDVRVQASLPNWSPASPANLCGKWQTSGQYSWRFLLVGGNLKFEWSTNGLAPGASATSTTVHGITNGTLKWIRATLDVDNGSGGHSVRFYKSDNGTTWSQIGSTVTSAGITSIFSGTSELAIGKSSSDTTPFAGHIYMFELLNGIGGTRVANLNVWGSGGTTFNDNQGRTWTIYGTVPVNSIYAQTRTQHDPALNIASIAAINAPMAAWYGLTDPLALPGEVEAMAAAVGENFELFPHPDGHDYTAVINDPFCISDWIVPKILAADV